MPFSSQKQPSSYQKKSSNKKSISKTHKNNKKNDHKPNHKNHHNNHKDKSKNNKKIDKAETLSFPFVNLRNKWKNSHSKEKPLNNYCLNIDLST